MTMISFLHFVVPAMPMQAAEMTGFSAGGGYGSGNTQETGQMEGGADGTTARQAFVNADGSFADGWQKSLGDEYEGLGKFRTVADLAKSYRHLEGKLPSYPGEGATPEQVARYRQMAAVPDSVDGYGIEAPEELPEGITWNSDAARRFTEIAHKYHVPAPALKALAAEQVAMETERAQQMQKMQADYVAKAENDLRQSWGSEFDARRQTANHVHQSLLSSMGIDANGEEARTLACSPVYVQLLYEVSRYMRQDTTGGSIPVESSVTGGKERGQDIINNPDNPLYRKYWEGDSGTQQLVRRLLS